MIPAETRVLASPRRQRFFRLIAQAFKLETHELLAILALRHDSNVLARAAIVRVLVARAPVSVTLGQCFAQRRRLVRRHHGI